MSSARPRSKKEKAARKTIRIVHLPSRTEAAWAACGLGLDVIAARGHDMATPGDKVPTLDVCLTCLDFGRFSRLGNAIKVTT